MGERLAYPFVTAFALLIVACGGAAGAGALDAAGVRPVTAGDLPGAPAIVRVTPGDGFATVEWTPPPGDPGAVSSYVVSGRPGGSRSVPGDRRTARVGGLTNGLVYTFTVRASNESGFGPDSGPSPSVLVAAPPGAPPAVAATGLIGGGVRMAWLAPNRDGGGEIVAYFIESELGGPPLVLTGETGAGYASITGGSLRTTPGQAEADSAAYVLDIPDASSVIRYRIAAGNALGVGAWSAWTVRDAVPVPEPDAVTPSEVAPPLSPTPAAGARGTPVTGTPGPGAVPTPTPTPPPAGLTASPAPPPPGPVPVPTPGAQITVQWLPTLYGGEGPPDGWRPALVGNPGDPFLLDSIEAWSTEPVDVFRGDVSWGDGTESQAWFEDPVYISSRTADGVAKLFAYHTYAQPGVYTVTVTVSAINHSGVAGQTVLDALIGQ